MGGGKGWKGGKGGGGGMAGGLPGVMGGGGGYLPGKAVDLTLKFLLAAGECVAVLGSGGATIKAIVQETGCKIHISSKNEVYPGTDLQEMKIRGANGESVLQAAQYAYAEIAKQFGAITAGDQTVQPGSAKLRCVVPSMVVKAIIG